MAKWFVAGVLLAALGLVFAMAISAAYVARDALSSARQVGSKVEDKIGSGFYNYGFEQASSARGSQGQ